MNNEAGCPAAHERRMKTETAGRSDRQRPPVLWPPPVKADRDRRPPAGGPGKGRDTVPQSIDMIARVKEIYLPVINKSIPVG